MPKRASTHLLDRASHIYRKGLLVATMLLVVITGYLLVNRSHATSTLAVRISGNHFVNAQGQTIRLLGVDRQGHCAQGTVLYGPTDQASVDQLKKWNVNAVRIIMNEDCWLGINGLPGNGLTASSLRSQMISYISLLNQNGIYVIFDLHTNAPGTLQSVAQQVMADQDHALAYWTSVANTFKTFPGVVLEAYNEPHITSSNTNNDPDPWACWRDGCQVNEYNEAYGGPKTAMNWQGVGMQQIVNTIRATGATNTISLGGLSWSNNLTGIVKSDAGGKPYLPSDPQHQLAASFHSYKGWGCGDSTCWNNQIAPVAQQMPVLTTEFGQEDCSSDYTLPYMNWADAHGVSYTAWSYVVGLCDSSVTSGPAGHWGLLSADGTTPNSYGLPILQHIQAQAANCTDNANLENPCRPWFGAAVSGDPAAANDGISQFNWLEGQIGHSMDFYRQYNNCTPNSAGTAINCTGGGAPMTPGSEEYKLGTRTNTWVDINWKPYSDWASAGGGNAMVDAEITQAAQNIKAIAPHKVMITIWHEPQNDVLAGSDGCTGAAHGNAGTPAQYNAMWQHVESIFAAQGVTNVVWAVDYLSTNQTDFDCQVPQLYPGANLVDWVLIDVYGTNNHPTWADSTGRLYSYLTQMENSNPGMNLASKPWGLGEYGTCGDKPSNTVTLQQSIDRGRQYYVDAKTAYDAGTYPKLKLFLVWDDNISGNGGIECLTNYDADGSVDNIKQADFNALGADILSGTGGGTPTSPTPSPTPSPSPSPTSPPPVTGDLNSDGKVNIFDLSILNSHWGTNYSVADLDHNGTVNVFDLSILLAHWTG